MCHEGHDRSPSRRQVHVTNLLRKVNHSGFVNITGYLYATIADCQRVGITIGHDPVEVNSIVIIPLAE